MLIGSTVQRFATPKHAAQQVPGKDTKLIMQAIGKMSRKVRR